MKRMTILILALHFLVGSIHAQEYTFKGEIRDENTGEPIPFAHCQILPERSTGFVADLNGVFSHQSEKESIEVLVTAIGYEPKKVALTAGQSHLIELEMTSMTFNEIVVTYVDHERVMLQKVLDSISKNYPQKRERITGKVIEQLATDSLYQDLIYTANATIEADKMNYSKRNKYGTVRILEGDVEFHQSTDSTFMRIVAGAHNVHRFDVIAARMPPFDHINSKKYRFELVDTLSYMGVALFKMQFDLPEYEGALYIQDSTFALVKAEYKVKKDKIGNFPASSGSERIFVNCTVEYFKENGFFRLNFINYQTGFMKIDSELKKQAFLNNFFYLSRHIPSDKSIPLKELMDFSNSLVSDLVTDSIAQLNNLDKNGIKENLTLNMGLGFLRYEPSSQLSRLQEISMDGQLINQKYEPFFSTNLNYKFNNVWTVGYTGGLSFNRKIISQSLLVNWNQPLSKNRRWLLGVGTGFNYLMANVNVGSGTPFGDLIQNTTLQDGNADLEEQARQFNLMTNLQLKYQVAGGIYVVIDGYLPLEWYNKLKVIAYQEDNKELLYQRNIKHRFQPRFYHINLGLQLNL